MGYAGNSGFLVTDDGKQAVVNYVWDTGTLAWVPQNSSGGSGPSSDVNVTNTSLAVTQSGAWSVGLSQYSPNSGRLPVLADINGSVPVTGTFWQATQPVSGSWLTDAQLRASAVPVSGTFWQATQPVSIAATINANPTTYNGKTLTYVSVAQGAAGTTVLAAASGSNKHKLLGCFLVMDAAGTLKFNDGTVDLSGAMAVGANGGFVMPPSNVPFLETAAVNRPLNLITTTGKAAGTVVILTEP